MAIAVEDLIGKGLYTVGEVARLIRARTPNVRRWVEGHTYIYRGEERFSEPIIVPALDKIRDQRILTFVNLIELKLVALFRSEDLSMPTIRAAAQEAAHLFKVEHPFATCQFRTDGRRIFAILEKDPPTTPDRLTSERFVEELNKGNFVFEDVVKPYFINHIDFDADERFARIWWPMGRDRRVVIDPARQFGKPIDHDTGVPTFVLYESLKSGETPEDIAGWYNVPLEALEEARDYEEDLQPTMAHRDTN